MSKTPNPQSLTELSLDALTADPNNARLHTERNLSTITSALQEVGAARSIVIDDDGVILAGNATAQAAQMAGLTRVQVVDADGDTLIAVRRRGLTPEQKARLALFDNRANDLSSFDPLMLAGLQAEGVSLDGLWTGDELDALLADLPSLDALTAESLSAEAFSPAPGGTFVMTASGALNDRESDELVRQRREDTQPGQVSPRPPSADTEPYPAPAPNSGGTADAPQALSSPAPVAGLDRVTPDQETSRAGLFLHFRALKIPVSAEEGALLDARLAAYREQVGTFYGFLGALLSAEKALSAGSLVKGKEAGDAEPA